MLGSSLRYLLPGEIAMYIRADQAWVWAIGWAGIVLYEPIVCLPRSYNRHAKHLFAVVAGSAGGDRGAGYWRED